MTIDKRFNRLIILMLFLLFPLVTHADSSSCGIDHYLAEYTLTDDSALTVTEQIEVSCSNYSNVHGIFRILPTSQPRPVGSNDFNKTPIQLESITAENGQPYDYTVEQNASHTVTWKIGDANQLLNGPKTYVIKYWVENAVLTAYDSGGSGTLPQDQFNWDILGAYWDWSVQDFQATINLPKAITQANASALVQAGPVGSKTDNGLVKLDWVGNSQLKISSLQPIPARNPVTLRMSFPVDLVAHYQPTFSEQYGLLVWLITSLIIVGWIFNLSYRQWNRYGRDERVRGSIAPEFGPPDKLRPLELSIIGLGGSIGQEAASTLIDLAVRGYIVLSEKPSRGLFGHQKFDFVKKNPADNRLPLNQFEQQFLSALSTDRSLDQKEDLTAAMKNVGQKWSTIRDAAKLNLTERGYFEPTGNKLTTTMALTGFAVIFLGGLAATIIPYLAIPLIPGGLIIFIFGLLMNKRTQKGAELYHRAKGFVMYLNKAEKYRQPFNEQENIFEMLLPYAILLGIAKQWAKMMERLYGDQLKNYHPVWFVGSGVFDSANLASSITSIAAVADSVSSSAGSSAGGGAGGGGGGGGGGGW